MLENHAMTRHRLRESIQSLYEGQIDPEKDEEFKQSKIEAENKLTRILKLAKDRHNNRRNRNADGRPELVELIEDFHRHYQLLYEGYDQLRGQLKQAFHAVKEDDDGFYTATSSSDSDSDSSKDTHTEKIHPSAGPKLEQNSENQEGVDSKQTESLKSDNMEEASSNVQEMQQMLLKLQHESKQLSEKVNEKEQELLAQTEIHRVRENEASALIRELKEQLHSLNLELGSVNEEKRRMEEQIGREGATAKQLQSEILELNAKVLSLEKLSTQRDAEDFALMEKVDMRVEDEEPMTGKTLSDSNSHAGSVDGVTIMRHELESMQRKNSELESQTKAKTQEISDYLLKLQNLEKELEMKTADYQKMERENEGSLALVKDLRFEITTLDGAKRELEKQVAAKDQENAQMRQETEGLEGKSRIMERILKERDDMCLSLQQKLENGEADKTSQIVALKTQIKNLEESLRDENQEKELLQKRIMELEKKLEARGDEISSVQNGMSSQIVVLTREVNHLQQEMDMKRRMDELISSQGTEINQLLEEKEGLQSRIMDLEVRLTEREGNISVLQRKIQDQEKESSARVSALSKQINFLQNELVTEQEKSQERLAQTGNQTTELTNKIADQQVILKQQEDTINRLREDCKSMKGRFLQAADRKMDEMAAEFRNNFEAQLRILNQRIRVAEQLHVENKDSCKRVHDRCEQEHSGLEKKLAEYSDISEMNKTEIKKISDAANEMVTAIATLITNKFTNEDGHFLQRLSKISDELQVTKDWVRSMINEMRSLKYDDVSSNANVYNVEQGDKIWLMGGMYELQKKVAELERQVTEKEAGMIRLGEEKVEAIRQLCLSIDYHHSRCNHLMEMLLVKRTRSQGRA